MRLSQLNNINKAAAELLGFEPINEAYHAKDREAKGEVRDSYLHHSNMVGRHQAVSSGVSKDKDLTKHDLAIIAHTFAAKHFNNLSGSNYGEIGGGSQLPADYHTDRDFYDKLNKLVSGRANAKSKECGLDTELRK